MRHRSFACAPRSLSSSGCCLLLLLPLLQAGCGKRVVDPIPIPVSRAPYGFQSTQAPAAAGTASAAVPGVAASTVSTQTPAAARYHEVLKGETLTGIASKYGSTVEKLQAANGLDKDATIKVGQLLFVP